MEPKQINEIALCIGAGRRNQGVVDSIFTIAFQGLPNGKGKVVRDY